MRYHWLTSLALAACACATAYEYEYVSGKLPFSESRFRAQVDAALDEAKKVLNVTRHPLLPNEVSHTYDDKYRLAELLTSLSDVAVLNVLGALGLSPEAREAARGWAAAGHAAVLRLNLTQQCELGDITSREVESDVKRREKSAFGTKDSYIVTTKHEARYTLRRRFKLSLYPGPDADDARAIELDSQELVSTLVTSISENSEAAALHASPKRPFAAAVEMDLTSLVRRLTPSGALAFRIDRTTAITPRRNTEVAEAHDFAQRLYDAATGMKWRLDTVMDEDASVGHKLFVPVVPLFEARPEEAEAATHNHTDPTRTASPPQSPPQSPLPQDDPHQSNVCEESRCSAPLLQPDDVGRLLSWHREGIRKAFAPSTPVQRLMLGLVNLREVAIAYVDGIGYIEETVREQLIAAVGKAVSARDLHSFMIHHYQRLYKSAYVPKPLTFAVRRPAHAPEGVLAIVDDKDQPVQMLGRQVVGHQPMTFALDSATQVTFGGERFLHVHMAQTFADEPPEDLWLHARARQFSSFAVLLGTCGGGQTFEPKHAFILQNKAELKIPLMLEQLPSHKAFRDAIASLSPEQQRFARAYRTLQLEGSVFGVLLIQLKPALEAVLNLPPDALTKEIALTQDLMKLFIEYQIPSDLLSYSGSDDASLGEKLAAVKEHARAITSMVDAEEREQIEQRERQREFAYGRKASGRRSSAGPERQGQGGPVNYGGAFAAAASVHDEAMPRTPRSPPPPPPPPGSPPPGSPPPGSPRGVGQGKAALPRAARSSSPSTPRAPPTPEPKQQQQQQQQAGETGNRGQRQGSAQETGSAADAAVGALDFSQVPSMLEAQYTKLDPLGAIRPTSIKVSEPSDRACVRRGYHCLWTQSTQKGLLAEPQRRYFGSLDPITSGERQRAFDLLDALTRSGTLPLQEAALHVIVAATHSFADSVMATLVEKSVNPIEKLEASSLIIASVVHGAPPLQLLRDQEQQARIGQFADTSLLSA